MSYGLTAFLTSYGVYLFVFFGINFGLSFIGAAMAKTKGYSYGGFLCLGMFTAFWIAIIVAAGLTPRAGSKYLMQKEMEQQFRQRNDQYAAPNVSYCGECGAQVASEMAFCPSCGMKRSASPTAL